MKKTSLLSLCAVLILLATACNTETASAAAGDTDTTAATTQNTETENTEMTAADETMTPDDYIPTIGTLALGDETTVYQDIIYDMKTGMTLDVYLPPFTQTPENGAQPVLYIHGGSWVEGTSRDIMQDMYDFCLAEGYVLISVNYDYASTEISCADMLAEINSAVEFIAENSAALHVDPSKKLAITGHSAGAHLSLMYAYTYKTPAVAIGVVNAWAPPTSFAAYLPVLSEFADQAPYMLPICENLCGMESGTLTGKPLEELKDTVLDDIDPLTYLSADVPPTIFVYGEQDEIVMPLTSTIFAEALDTAGVTHETFALPDSGHMLENNPDIIEASLASFKAMIEASANG